MRPGTLPPIVHEVGIGASSKVTLPGSLEIGSRLVEARRIAAVPPAQMRGAGKSRGPIALWGGLRSRAEDGAAASAPRVRPSTKTPARRRRARRLGQCLDRLPVKINIAVGPSEDVGLANFTTKVARTDRGPGFLDSVISRAALRADEDYRHGRKHSINSHLRDLRSYSLDQSCFLP